MIVELLTLPGIPLVKKGDDLAALIVDGLSHADIYPREGDIFVLAQKIVSKAEGRMVNLSSVVPSVKAIELSYEVDKDPRLVELVLSETASIIRARRGLLLVEHRLGFVMPNAGIDMSNVGAQDWALLLPVDPDASAKALRARLSKTFGFDVAVVINDSVSRPWRNGTCGVAIGSAGLPALNDIRGTIDLFGRVMQTSTTGFADEISAAASLLMGQGREGTPIVVMRGLKWRKTDNGVSDLLRRPSVAAAQLAMQV
jgi:coenzyme F420-0:L-glutamate ligase/coenzyme F420-1:gamma-L-glutamate ligase